MRFTKAPAVIISIFLLLLLEVPFAFAQCDCVTEEPRNCAVPIIKLDGQTLHISGVGAGVTSDANLAADFTLPADLFPNAEGKDTKNVAILVVDDFSNRRTEATTPFFTSDEISTYAGLSGSELDDQFLYDSIENASLTHGALVFNHINSLLQGALGEDFTRNIVDTDVVWEGKDTRSGVKVMVKMVDALDYGDVLANDTRNVANVVSSAIFSVPPEYEHIVVNMSFAILPCLVAENYNGVDPFRAYLRGLAAAGAYYPREAIIPDDTWRNPDAMHYLIGQCVSLPLVEGDEGTPEVSLPEGLEPISGIIEIPCDGSRLVEFVGSAGNSKLPFPFFPAAWDEVDSVSASEPGPNATEQRADDYTNYNADKGLRGGWFQLSAVNVDNPADVLIDLPVFYRGTSFSGPVDTVCLALGITTEPSCTSISNP